MPIPPFRSRIRAVPSAVTGDLYFWLSDLAKAVNGIPQVSYFSAPTPNSVVTGLTGDLAVNLVSGSTDTRVWVMGGNNLSVLTTLGWVTLRTNA